MKDYLSSDLKNITLKNRCNNNNDETEENKNLEILKKINEIDSTILNILRLTNELHDIGYVDYKYYTGKFEKEFLKPFMDYMNQSDFYSKYISLCNGLDIRSVREINKILSRIQFIKNKIRNKKINIYSIEEQQERIKIFTNFTNRFVRISDNLYVYDNYKLPICHFERCVFLYKHGISLVKNLDMVRTKDIIDAGGFIGDSALILSEYTDKSIFSFEANPNNLKLFYETIKLNNLKNVHVIEKALYSSETELTFNLNDAASSINKLHGINYGNSITVQATTIDKFVGDNKLDIGLIKLDVEGAELDVLIGAEKTIKKFKPVLLLSIYHKPSDFFELKPILEKWVPDYNFTIYNPVDINVALETMIIAQPNICNG